MHAQPTYPISFEPMLQVTARPFQDLKNTQSANLPEKPKLNGKLHFALLLIYISRSNCAMFWLFAISGFLGPARSPPALTVDIHNRGHKTRLKHSKFYLGIVFVLRLTSETTSNGSYISISSVQTATTDSSPPVFPGPTISCVCNDYRGQTTSY